MHANECNKMFIIHYHNIHYFNMTQSYNAIFYHIAESVVEYGRVQYGRVWQSLVEYGRVQYGRVWWSMVEYGRVW